MTTSTSNLAPQRDVFLRRAFDAFLARCDKWNNLFKDLETCLLFTSLFYFESEKELGRSSCYDVAKCNTLRQQRTSRAPAKVSRYPPANATFEQLRTHVQQPRYATHPLAALAWRRETLLGHARALRTFFGTPVETRLLQMPMIPALFELVSHLRRERNWRWTSTLRAMAELAGALQQLGCQGIPSVTLSDHVDWLAAIRGVAGRGKAERPRVPKAATAASMLRLRFRVPGLS